MAVDLAQELRGHLADIFRHRIVDSKGQLLKGLYLRRGRNPLLSKWGGFAGPAAAYLVDTDFDGNPFHGNEELRRLALDAGDRLLIDHAHVTPGAKPNHFSIYPMARLYQLARGYAGRARLARWRDLMVRNLRATDALIDRAWENLGKPGPWSGTGPNHYFGWFAVAYQQAEVLGEAVLAAKIEMAMRRQLNIQARGGYFPEHIGPATVYHQVSLGGLAEFHRLCPRSRTLAAVQRGADFLTHALYPDLRGIETFDERNRLCEAMSLQPGLFWTAEGRALAVRVLSERRRVISKQAGRPLVDRGWWDLGATFRAWEHAVAAKGLPVARRLPVERERFVWPLEDKGLVRKQGPWFYAMSAWARPAEPGNPYHLDRTQALSIYHSVCGLIVGGGNDKRAYHNATIHILEGGDCHYFPPVAGKLLPGVPAKVLSGGGRCDRIEFDYGSVRAQLEVRADSPQRLRVALGIWTSQTKPQIWLTLQLPALLPRQLQNGGRKFNLPKAKEGQAAREYPLGRTLGSRSGWTMSLPAGSTLLWPHVPWNSYRPPTYLEVPDRAVALVRVPLHTHNGHVEVVINATPR